MSKTLMKPLAELQKQKFKTYQKDRVLYNVKTLQCKDEMQNSFKIYGFQGHL